MSTTLHAIIADPVLFHGGHKNAANKIISLMQERDVRITVITADQSSWMAEGITRQRLWVPAWLQQQETGLCFYLQHLFIAFNILIARLIHGRIDVGIGISGPGIDMALYLLKPFLGYRIVQMIKGPVAASRSIGTCLTQADNIYHLESMGTTLDAALSTLDSNLGRSDLTHCDTMENGLLEHEWPTPCHYETPRLFWAASLLRWKGLDLLTESLELMNSDERPLATVCYIKPVDTTLEVSTIPVSSDTVSCYESPDNLDTLRSECNIFVSTSSNEPFGLSILEAIAAGHCVLIPEDGAYWDQHLRDNIDCVKYCAGDANDLRLKILDLLNDQTRLKRIGLSARATAEQYRAEKKYRDVIDSIANPDEAQGCRGGLA